MKTYKFEMTEKNGKVVTHCYTTSANSKIKAMENFMAPQGNPGIKPKFKAVISK